MGAILESSRPAYALRRLTEFALFRRWQSEHDHDAREELARRYLPLARKLASGYARSPEPFDDLYQVASLGLVKAIDRFDSGHGTSFSSFAVPTILGELKRHFRDKGRAVHLPRGLHDLVLQVQDADAELSSTSRRPPTVAELADYMRVGVEQVIEALDADAAQCATSMDEAVDRGIPDETVTRHDFVGSDDQGYALVETSASLATEIKRLRVADRRILALRVQQDLRQRDIAERIGVSQMQVSRMLHRIREQLRDRADLP